MAAKSAWRCLSPGYNYLSFAPGAVDSTFNINTFNSQLKTNTSYVFLILSI